MNSRAILTIARKDIIDAVRNLYILFGLLLPIGLSLFLSFVFPDEGEMLKLTIAVYDPGGSRLVTELQTLSQVTLRQVASEQLLSDEVKKNAVGGLAIPVGFDTALQAGEKPELGAYVNRRRGGGEIAAFQQLVDQQVWSLVDQEAPARVVWTDVGTSAGFQGEFRFQRIMLVMFLVMALGMTGTFMVPTLLVEEKEKHTLDSLLISPAGPKEIAAGKALTGMSYSLLCAGVLIAMNKGWVGNWPITFVTLVLGSLFVVMVGLLMGSLFQNAHQVNTWSSIILLVLIAPSWIGLVGPATLLEVFLRLIPTYYMTHAMGLSLAGKATFALVWGDMAILVGCIAVVFIAVVWAIKREGK